MQKGNVLRNIKNQIEIVKQEKQIVKKYYEKKFDKIQEDNFINLEECNMQVHAVIPKKLIKDDISLSAKSLYMVLSNKANFKEQFQISLKTLAFEDGCSVNTTRKSLDILTEHKYLKRKKVKTKNNRNVWTYELFYKNKIMRQDKYKGERFWFYLYLVQSGIWASLSPREKCFYLSLRCLAILDLTSYNEIEETISGDTYEYKDFKDYEQVRKWDICIDSLESICKYSHMSSVNLQSVIDKLEKCRLIRKCGKYIQVYLRPQIIE